MDAQERDQSGNAGEAPVTVSFAADRGGRVGPPSSARTPLVERHPLPDPADVVEACRALLRARARVVDANSLAARDPALIRAAEPLLDLMYDQCFDCETEFLSEIPEGPVLLVANHNGITGTPDMFCHMTAFWRRNGADRTSHGLMHDVPFRVPWAGAWLNAAGAVAANHSNGERALRAGAALLVFPGGDWDACKPFAARHRIDFGDRRGYVRLALRERVPIMPVVSVGAHESLWVARRGERVAKALRLPKYFRTNVFPVGFALPWGPLVGLPLPHAPLPVKIHTRILPPIRSLEDRRSSDAEDPSVVEAVHAEVVGAMQREMDAMVKLGRFGIWPVGRRENLARTLQSLANSFRKAVES